MIRIDSKFYHGLESIYRLLVLNALLVLFSIPVVTIGASLSAFFAVLHEDQPRGFIRGFVRAFRQNFFKTLLPLGFSLMSIVFTISLYLSGGSQSGFFWFLRIIFTSFLVCFNLNVYLLQSQFRTKHAYALLRSSFFFTVLTFMRTVLYPLGITFLAWLTVKYLGDFLIVIILAAALAIYLRLVKKPLTRFLDLGFGKAVGN